MAMRLGTLFFVLLAGCECLETTRPLNSWQSQKIESAPDSNRVLLDVCLLQRPLGDPFLTDGIWASADEMILPPDQRELLQLNGFRVGLLVGSPPDKLLDILKSDRDCIERRGRATPTGTTIEQKLFEHTEAVEASVYLGKGRGSLSLERPRFGLDLTPTLKPRDVVHLTFAPRYEAGDKEVSFKPVPSESKWSMEVKRPTRLLADLAVTLDLTPDQLLVIGPRLERDGSIGYHSFVGERDGTLCQRLVVLRHVRSKAPAVEVENVDASFGDNPPLAVRAATSRRP